MAVDFLNSMAATYGTITVYIAFAVVVGVLLALCAWKGRWF